MDITVIINQANHPCQRIDLTDTTLLESRADTSLVPVGFVAAGDTKRMLKTLKTCQAEVDRELRLDPSLLGQDVFLGAQASATQHGRDYTRLYRRMRYPWQRIWVGTRPGMACVKSGKCSPHVDGSASPGLGVCI